MKKLILLSCFITLYPAWSFVPPLNEVLKKAFSGRRWMPTETQFRHQIKLESSRAVIIDEKLVEIDGQTHHLFSWQNGAVSAISSSAGYLLGNKKKLFGSSALFNSYFTLSSSDRFRQILISEGFSRPQQWEQYQSSFLPEGNPALWDIKENYLFHPDVFFSRTQRGVNITVIGTDTGANTRSVSFDKESFLLSGITWKQGKTSDSWWFRGKKRISKMGSFPVSMGFISDGSEIIATNLIQRRYLNAREKKLWLQKVKSHSQSEDFSEIEPALKILLSRR